jgi:hypothetical protein
MRFLLLWPASASPNQQFGLFGVKTVQRLYYQAQPDAILQRKPLRATDMSMMTPAGGGLFPNG